MLYAAKGDARPSDVEPWLSEFAEAEVVPSPPAEVVDVELSLPEFAETAEAAPSPFAGVPEAEFAEAAEGTHWAGRLESDSLACWKEKCWSEESTMRNVCSYEQRMAAGFEESRAMFILAAQCKITSVIGVVILH